MAEPKISWQLLEEVTVDTYEYVQYKSYTEEGSSVPGSTIERTIRVWNNYMGKTTVDDALDCSLVLAFKNFPDAPLFIWVILGMLGVLVSEGGK